MKSNVLLSVAIMLVCYSCQKESFNKFQEEPSDKSGFSSIQTLADPVFNDYFTRYGSGWTGGDATYSILLPDGRTLWMFGDTFMDTVYADRSRPFSGLIRNSFVLQDEEEFTTLYRGTYSDPESFIPSSNPDEWYWPLDGFVNNNKLFVFLSAFRSSGTGIFGFEFIRTELAVFSLPDINLLQIKPIQDKVEIYFGSSVLVQDDTLYVYGSEPFFITQYGHVFRMDLGDLNKAPEFYAGADSWSTDPRLSQRMLEGPFNEVDLSQQFKVFEFNDKFYLLSQIALNDKIYLYDSDKPYGIWQNKRLVYTTPESGGDIFTYNAFVHTQFTEELGGFPVLLMSYNVNSFKFLDLFNNADIYKPRFVRIRNWE